ncbi:hypothetical protein BDV93DRAFT_609072 [Ceratobasidium sp. AG-I]|nr:hypothetical protein BDV93DRAFT_609072 [Ceratobasidium sp. AG-I]
MVIRGARDPKYYFDDGNVILLVGGTLFKIHRSLITSSSGVFKDMFKLPTQSESNRSDVSPNLEGSSDENPITVPQVLATQFRDLMLFFYGVLTDSDYVTLAFGAQDEAHHTAFVFERYLNIASLANRFCMAEVETWARDQFNRVLGSSQRLSTEIWNRNTLLNALAYAKLGPDLELEHNIRAMIECCLEPLDGSQDSIYGGWVHSCVAQFYKHPTLKTQDPALFGYIFCVVLSAGHQSPLWKERLTRNDRYILFAAQAHLTPLPATLPTDWIGDASKISSMVDAQVRPGCFQSCSQRFKNSFNTHFNCRTALTQNSPLTGVTALASLATRRQSLAESFKPLNLQCKCMNQLISAIDVKMDALFTELAEKYHDCLD